MIASWDTETTGVDLRHSARPFFVTRCNEEGVKFWEWEVNPLTRQPIIPNDDLDEIREEMAECDEVVAHNGKFDSAALASVGVGEWPWDRFHDTLIAAHLLASNQPHNLTDSCVLYLGKNIQPYEDRLKQACVEARRLARSKFPEWKIAKEGLPGFPSIRGSGGSGKGEKDAVWKNDTWLPRAIAVELGYPDDHPWWRVLRDYGNMDSSVTLPLWMVMREELERRGLWEIYLEGMKVARVVKGMEDRGGTISVSRTCELKEQYVETSGKAHDLCIKLAGGKMEALPKSGSRSKALEDTIFNHFGLRSSIKTKKGADSINAAQLGEWMVTLPARSKAQVFVKNLLDYRKRKTAIGFIESYEKFWVEEGDDIARLYMSLNQTGTKTLRFSMSNPNGQQVSKKEIKEEGGGGHNAKYMFGPAPGREWWAIDYENIELRIPAYEAGEQLMIDLFERPDEPPYYGSNHLLMFDILHPEMFAKHGKAVKDVFASTWYQWTKNGNFAVQYGAMAESGTADRAYHVPGAQRRIETRLTNIKRLSQSMIDHANKHGYVETMPDKTVNPNRGYPLECARGWGNRVRPTEPLSYHVQGTAMWCTRKAMVRCDEYLQRLTRRDPRGYYIVLQVHDEIVFDFPAGGAKNLTKINECKRLMELSGDDIGVPLKAAVSYHPNNWMHKETPC